MTRRRGEDLRVSVSPRLPFFLYGVAESERRESLKLVYVGSNPTSVAKLRTRSSVLIKQAPDP